MTVPQVRAIFTRQLHNPPTTPWRVARDITDVLTRNEEARIYHWHATTGQFPPPLNFAGGSG